MRGCPSRVHERLTRWAGVWTQGASAVALAVSLAATMVVLLGLPHASTALTAPTSTSVPTPSATVPQVKVPTATVPTVTVPTVTVPTVTVPTVTVPTPPPVSVPTVPV